MSFQFQASSDKSRRHALIVVFALALTLALTLTVNRRERKVRCAMSSAIGQKRCETASGATRGAMRHRPNVRQRSRPNATRSVIVLLQRIKRAMLLRVARLWACSACGPRC